MTSLIAATSLVVLLSGASVGFAQSAHYENAGFPLAPHQAEVLGAANIRELASAPDLIANEMPASPHQMAVLAPRLRQTAAAPVSRQQKTN